MSRIENNVASQVGDVTRPVQNDLERRQQVRAAQEEARASSEAAAAQEVQADELGGVLAALQKVVETATGKALQFSLNEETEDLVVTVTDRESQEVIRQIPQEEVLSLRERMRDLVGLMVDKLA